MIDRLIESINKKGNPSVAGIDTSFDYLPENMTRGIKTAESAAKAIEEFNAGLIDALCDVVPAVKVQAAYYEMYGVPGLAAFEFTLKYARERGLIVIADAKRNDIGSTAACYSKAFLGKTEINGNAFSAFESDFLTVNGYLGEDGIKPFVKDCAAHDKGIFVLCKTSNPSGVQLQDVKVDGREMYRIVGGYIEEWGATTRGKYGYSDVGAVVGATYPEQARILRREMPHTFFLVPGYGAQGGKAGELVACFDEKGGGAIVNSSRGIICAYKQERYAGMKYAAAARAAAEDMREDLRKAIGL